MNSELIDADVLKTELIEIITSYGLNVLGAFAILVAGWIAASWAQRTVVRLLAKSRHIDDTIGRFLASIARYGVIIFTVLAVLSQFGVQTTGIIALLGTMGLAVGLALQGTLGHIAAGVMLMIFRPFKIGDFIEVAGYGGTVKAITLFTTELATGDNVQIILPNGTVWGDAIKNFSVNDTRRLEITLGISYNDNIDQALALVRKVIDNDSRTLSDPDPLIVVSELADSSVNILLRVWVNRGDYSAVRWDLTKNLKEQCDAAGIEIPYPQQVVHIEQSDQND